MTEQGPESAIAISVPAKRHYDAKGRKKDRYLKILELAAKEISQEDIAKIIGISQQHVSVTLQKFSVVFKNLERVNEFRQVRADLLSAAQLSVLESGLSHEKLESAKLPECARAFDIFYKAERLERGLSTDNQAIQHLKATSLPNE